MRSPPLRRSINYENQNNLNIIKTPFEGLLIIEPRVFEDDRGFFYESYNKKSFRHEGIEMEFVQDNQSYSQKGVLRGLHFQKPPHAQTKLVCVLAGVVQDVVVDLRKSQPTYGRHYSIELSSLNRKRLLIPKGFAHGFLVLSESADVLYKCDEYYHPESEGGMLYDDPTLGIDWQMKEHSLSLSSKDRALPLLSGAGSSF